MQMKLGFLNFCHYSFDVLHSSDDADNASRFVLDASQFPAGRLR